MLKRAKSHGYLIQSMYQAKVELKCKIIQKIKKQTKLKENKMKYNHNHIWEQHAPHSSICDRTFQIKRDEKKKKQNVCFVYSIHTQSDCVTCMCVCVRSVWSVCVCVYIKDQFPYCLFVRTNSLRYLYVCMCPVCWWPENVYGPCGKQTSII